MPLAAIQEETQSDLAVTTLTEATSLIELSSVPDSSDEESNEEQDQPATSAALLGDNHMST
jgi:hypothetical protein